MVELDQPQCLLTRTVVVVIINAVNVVFVNCQGNYDSYVQTRGELLENQMKRYKWEQDQISNMKVGAAEVSPLIHPAHSVPTRPPTVQRHLLFTPSTVSTLPQTIQCHLLFTLRTLCPHFQTVQCHLREEVHL